MPNAKPVRSDCRNYSTSEDALLLREFAHRAFNELAVATAAVALAGRAVAGASGAELLAEATRRLESVAALLRLLARTVPARMDVASEIAGLCRAMHGARPRSGGGALDLDLPETWVDGAAGRRLALVAAELLANAHRHALAGRAGVLAVVLRRVGRELVLEVRDDGPGGAARPGLPGLGLGRGIVGELMARAGGRVELHHGEGGTVARALMPVASFPGMARVV